MIISPPILKPQAAQQSDESWVDSLLPPQGPEKGEFPILDNLSWHGGYHVHQTDIAAIGDPVRAIADGVVVYARYSDGAPANGIEPLAYGTEDNRTTDNGCVVIQHTTEIGDQVSVTYYSVYMHMRKESSYEGVIRKGTKVYRKQAIGLIGKASNKNMIHMEIVCDQENLEKLVGRNTPDLDLSKDGRTSVVYGDIHFYLSKGTKFYAQKDTSSAAIASEIDLFVTLQFDKGEAYLSTRKEVPAGSGIYQMLGEAALVKVAKPHHGNEPVEYYQYEYDLYTIATKQATAAVPPSAVYELLRFGRILDTDVERSNISDVKHWHEVNYGGGLGYVNLNVSEIKKFSDGDFPHWMGWRLIDDDSTPDSQCNSPILQKWLDTDGNSKNTHAELTAALNNATVQAILSKAICNFPTEWAKALFDTQYSWIKTASDALPEPLTEDDYTKFKAHVTALSFWEEMQAPAKGVLPPTKHWHFHPREFIKHFRKCGWLSEDELEQIYKPLALGQTTDVTKISTYKEIIKINIASLNKMTRKYALNTRSRLPHILGQGAIESAHLRTMQESAMNGNAVNGSVHGLGINPQSKVNESGFGHWWGAELSERVAWYGSTKYNSSGGLIASSYNWRGGNLGDPDAQKFRGRGFKQLTGRDNYVHYWVYRGWLAASSFDDQWWSDPQYQAHHEAGMTKRAGIVDNPEAVTETPYNCMDSGGWYMTFQRPTVNKKMDGDFNYLALSLQDIETEKATSKAVTRAINGGEIQWDDRLKASRAAKKILLDF